MTTEPKTPFSRRLKQRIRLQPDKVQCQEIRKVLPGCLRWERFVEAWKPCDLILTTRLKVRDRAVAVCRIAPQAALLEQSLAMGHRRPAGSTTRSCRAWSSSVPAIHFKRPHRVSGLPATTLQFTGLVKVANADPRGDFLLFEAKGASRDYKRELLCQYLGLDGIRGLFAS